MSNKQNDNYNEAIMEGHIMETKCKHEYYRTIKENDNSVVHHKCVCTDCGAVLDPITLQEIKD